MPSTISSSSNGSIIGNAMSGGVDNTIYKPWSQYAQDRLLSQTPPVLGSFIASEIEEAAKQHLKEYPDAFLYVFASAGTNSTDKANRDVFSKWAIVPRMLRDVSTRTLETTIFGVKMKSPLFLSPISSQTITHPDGECASAAAAGKLGVTYIMSGAASRTIEDVASANGPGGHRWYQFYWPRSTDIAISILTRAKENGFTALVVTVDTMVIGWRPHDLATGYLPFRHGMGTQTAFADPVFMSRFGEEPILDLPKFPYDPKALDELYRNGDERTRKIMYIGAEWVKETATHFWTWEDLKFVREHWDGPIVLKGIQHPKDAEIAIDHGMDGIIVSNHGGRQIDGALPSLLALQKICSSSKVKQAQSSGKLTILYDSGLRTGSDAFKAIALGAQGVCLGRPYIYGLTLAGEIGVDQVIRGLLAELELTLGLAGFTSIQDIHGKAEEIMEWM
ncbi:oxidoreductase [Abortiporus biennis]|nr:oxidoreductase [Abortiporus biennis]